MRRGDRLAADPRALRPAARGRARADGGAQPRGGRGGGRRAGRGAGAGGRAGARRPARARDPRRPAAAARAARGGAGGVRGRAGAGAERGGAGVPRAAADETSTPAGRERALRAAVDVVRPLRRMRGDLPDFGLEVYLGEWEFAAAPPPHRLGRRRRSRVAEVLGPRGWRSSRALALGYTPTWGTDALRAAIAATYETLAPEDVLVFAGAEEAMFWALQELAGPGDDAVVTVPNYQSMESVPLADGRGRPRARAPSRGRLGARPRRARRAASRPPRGSSPSTSPTTRPARSPTRRRGTRCSPLCEERGIRLFSDEVYRGLEPAGTPRLVAGRRPQRDGDLARRDVEGLRAARPADRLARVAATARCSPGWRRASTTRRSAAPARAS